MSKLAVSFLRDESGATAIEHSLMMALLGVAIVSALDVAGSALGGVFQSLSLDLAVAEGSGTEGSGTEGGGPRGDEAGDGD